MIHILIIAGLVWLVAAFAAALLVGAFIRRGQGPPRHRATPGDEVRLEELMK